MTCELNRSHADHVASVHGRVPYRRPDSGNDPNLLFLVPCGPQFTAFWRAYLGLARQRAVRHPQGQSPHSWFCRAKRTDTTPSLGSKGVRDMAHILGRTLYPPWPRTRLGGQPLSDDCGFRASLRNTDLRGALSDGTDLRGADARGAKITNCSFRRGILGPTSKGFAEPLVRKAAPHRTRYVSSYEIRRRTEPERDFGPSR